MKRLLVISMLLLFLLQSMSTMWIVVSFYLRRDYIVKNLCINRFDLIPVCKGQCYLSDQLKKDVKQEKDMPEIKVKEAPLFLQASESFVFRNEATLLKGTFDLDLPAFYINIDLPDIEHPPS